MTVSWEEAFGPLHSTAEAASILGVSVEELTEMAHKNEALKLEDGQFPGWQFDPEQHRVYPAIVAIMDIFYERDLVAIDVASFCVSPSPDLDEHRLIVPLDLFPEGAVPEIATAARRTAARLTD